MKVTEDDLERNSGKNNTRIGSFEKGAKCKNKFDTNGVEVQTELERKMEKPKNEKTRREEIGEELEKMEFLIKSEKEKESKNRENENEAVVHQNTTEQEDVHLLANDMIEVYASPQNINLNQNKPKQKDAELISNITIDINTTKQTKHSNNYNTNNQHEIMSSVSRSIIGVDKTKQQTHSSQIESDHKKSQKVTQIIIPKEIQSQIMHLNTNGFTQNNQRNVKTQSPSQTILKKYQKKHKSNTKSIPKSSNK